MSDRTNELIGQLHEADSELDAGVAASDLLDRVVPGRAAVVSDAAEVVAAIVGIDGLRHHRYRAYFISVLAEIALWSYIWRRRLGKGDARASALAAAADEEAVANALVLAAATIRSFTDDDDPEVRAVTYNFLGNFEPERLLYASELLDAAESDPEPKAKSRAASSLLSALIRRIEDDVVLGVEPRLRRIYEQGDCETRRQMALVSPPESDDEAGHTRLIRILGEVPAASGKEVFWPAETV